MPIDAITAVSGLANTSEVTKLQPGTPVGFGETLTRVLDAVQTTGEQANSSIVDMVDGKADVHEAMIALTQADLTLQLAMQVRNKLVTAYQEVMRMPL
jgi:flagellar hook-basal body complex protein FliE